MIQRHVTRSKSYIVSSLLPTLLLLATVGNSAAKCPDRYVSVGTGCYYFDDQDRITWYQAYFKCKINLKGYLVEIWSQEEQNDLRQYIQNVIDAAGKYSFWIGASDLLLENEFRWMTTGNRTSFTAWAGLQPNNAFGSENCVMMWKATDYSWNDLSCTNTGDLQFPPLRAICEAAPTP